MQVSVRVRYGADESRGGCERSPVPWTVVQKIIRDLLGPPRAEDPFERAMGAVRYFVKAPAVAVLRPDRGSRLLRSVRSVGLSPDFGRAYRVRAGEGAEGLAFHHRRATWITDIQADGPGGPEAESVRRVLASDGIRAIVGAPLRGQGEIVGVLAGYYPGAHAFTAEEVALLGIIADLAGLAVRQREEVEAALEDAALTGARQLAIALSHEINTPLATLLGTVKLLLRQGQAPTGGVVGSDRGGDGSALASIQSAGEEIAGVLRRVQCLNRYRTTEYVGGLQMIDLDAAILDEEPGWPRQVMPGGTRELRVA